MVACHAGVGKTSLMHRYSEDEFAPNLLSTAGVDFKVSRHLCRQKLWGILQRLITSGIPLQVRHITLDGKKIKCQVKSMARAWVEGVIIATVALVKVVS